MINYVVKRVDIGNILVAKSERGVCAIFLGENKKSLINSLHLAYPKTPLKENNEQEIWAQEILSYINEPRGPCAIALDIEGTPFQKEVWQALMSIPRGETLTYKALAQKMNQEKSYRAVANACGANKIAILIPCHRVVGQKGNLTGYRWGLEKKEKLLEREKINSLNF